MCVCVDVCEMGCGCACVCVRMCVYVYGCVCMDYVGVYMEGGMCVCAWVDVEGCVGA